LDPWRILSIHLRLAKSGQVFGDRFFGIKAQGLRVGADETLVEDATGKNVETFLFDGFQHTRADLGDVGNVIESQAAPLPLLAKFFSEPYHRGPTRATEKSQDHDAIIIGQQAHLRYNDSSFLETARADR
jgi:hypothetical protein